MPPDDRRYRTVPTYGSTKHFPVATGILPCFALPSINLVLSFCLHHPFRWQAADSLGEAYGKNLNKERVRQELAAKVCLCVLVVFRIFFFFLIHCSGILNETRSAGQRHVRPL